MRAPCACALPERRRVCAMRMCALEQSERAHQRLMPLALRKRKIPSALYFLKHIARPAPASADAVRCRRRCAGRCATEGGRPPAQPTGRSTRPMRSARVACGIDAWRRRQGCTHLRSGGALGVFRRVSDEPNAVEHRARLVAHLRRHKRQRRSRGRARACCSHRAQASTLSAARMPRASGPI